MPRTPFSVRRKKRLPLGLDVGEKTVKWVQLESSKGRAQLFDMGAVTVEPPLDLPAIAARHHLRGLACLSLPLEDVQMRCFKMPPGLAVAEVDQAVRWQIEQTLPKGVSYEEFITDHRVLDPLKESAESRVLVVSSPKQRIQALVDSVRRAGLQPLSVDVDPFALATAFSWAGLFHPEETSLVLHLGESRSFLSIVCGGQLSFSRTLLTSGRQLTQMVAERLQVPFEQAEQLKRQHGILRVTREGTAEAPAAASSDDGLMVAEALVSSLENLVVDLLHTFKSFSYQMTQSEIQQFNRLYLAGGSAKLRGLGPWLESRVNVPVVTDPFQPFFSSAPSSLTAAWRDSYSQFGVALGLALREAVP